MVIRCSVETRKLLDKLLRVDHAKGLAAKYMYKGQLAVLNAGHASSAIEVGSFFFVYCWPKIENRTILTSI